MQPDPESMADDNMSDLRREVEALGADAVALRRRNRRRISNALVHLD